MKLYKNQSGFSPVEIIIIIVMIGLTGAVGWLVYDRQKKTDHSSQTQALISNFEECVAAGNPVMESYPEQCAANGRTFINDTQQPNNETAEYIGERHTSSKGGFSMVLLNGWQVRTDTTYDYFFQYDVGKLTYNSTEKLQVAPTDASGVGGYVPGIKVSINEHHERLTNGEAFTLHDGATGYCKSNKASAQDISDSPVGGETDKGSFISRYCFFEKNGKRLLASYAYYESQPLNTAAIEWAFKTIEIK